MRKRTRGLAAGAAGLALAVAGIAVTPGTANAEPDGGVRIMPLGDSITDGLDGSGGYRVGLWRRLVTAGYRNDFVGSQFNGPSGLRDHDHEGHPGWRIDQIDANIVGWLRASAPHSVLLHLGTNDVLNEDAPSAPGRLSTLIDHITTTLPDTEVFVATIIPMGWPSGDDAVRSFNREIPALVQSKARSGKHVHLVDMYAALTPSSDLAADGVHPTALGYDKLAAVWYRALRSVPGAAGARDNPRWIRHSAVPRGHQIHQTRSTNPGGPEPVGARGPGARTRPSPHDF